MVQTIVQTDIDNGSDNGSNGSIKLQSGNLQKIQETRGFDNGYGPIGKSLNSQWKPIDKGSDNGSDRQRQWLDSGNSSDRQIQWFQQRFKSFNKGLIQKPITSYSNQWGRQWFRRQRQCFTQWFKWFKMV